MNCDHVFVDLAVTHPNPRIGQIIGIAAVRTTGKGKVLDAFSEKIRPTTALTEDERRHLDIIEDYPSEGANAFRDVIKSMKKCVLSDRYESLYIVVATHADTDRAYLKGYTEDKAEVFAGRAWLDILAISWPLVYNDQISDRGFDSLCKHFQVENTAPNTATGDCEALVRVYWALMKRYKTALGGEEILREIGGGPLENFRKYIGL
jgi:DNA polymerase III alpha subunit (gram-positive type)